MSAFDPQETAWMNRTVLRVLSVLWVMFGSLFFAVGVHIALHGDPYDLNNLINKGVVLGPFVVFLAICGCFVNSKTGETKEDRSPIALWYRCWPYLAAASLLDAIVLVGWTLYLHRHGFVSVWIR